MKAMDLLSRRGFLIEQNKDLYYLSDNSDPNDAEYLNSLLRNNALGYVNKNSIVITADDEDACAALSSLFLPVKRGTVGVGSCIQSMRWSHHVAKRWHAYKIPVKWLEANIAAYIKALSACGIFTGGCCDGNHPGRNVLYIEFCGPVYSELHKILWKYHLDDLFSLKWNKEYDSINLNGNRQSQYDELFRAAQYIYNHRWELINIRLDAASWMKKNALKHLTNEDIKDRFIRDFTEEVKRHYSSIK